MKASRLVFIPMVTLFALHVSIASLATYELNRKRSGRDEYKALQTLSIVGASFNLALFAFYVFRRHADNIPYKSAHEYLKQIALFLTYTLVAWTLAETEADVGLVSDQNSWFIVSTPLKLFLVWYGFNNGMDQAARATYTITSSFNGDS